MDRTKTAENFQRTLDQYQQFLSTPNPDDPNFDDRNTAFNYIRELDPNKAREILYYLDRLGIDRRFLWRVTVDHRIEMLHQHVGGYFELNKNFIGLNSAILRHGSVNTIVHIIYHEALHAGVIEDLNDVRVKDEALVEFITVQKMKSVFNGKDDFVSGYSEIVDELEELLGAHNGEIDIDFIIEQINSSNIEMLDRFLEIIVLNPLLDTWNVNYLKYSEIQDELKKKWSAILKLFPRLINDIDNPTKSPHEEAIMNLAEYKLENLLQKAASRIFENPALLLQILFKVKQEFKREIKDDIDLKDKLVKSGYAYIADYANKKGLNLYSLISIEA